MTAPPMTDLDRRAWQACVKQFQPKVRRWASPLDMAQDLDSTIVRTPALELINDALMDVAEGRETRLMVCMPPQEAKSTTVAYRFPEYLLACVDPSMRILIVSYGDEIARRW